MTQQYLIGELSLRLAQLQAVVADEASAHEVAHLRQEVERGPFTGLASVVARTLELTDKLCWDSLAQGDTAAFTREAATCAELCEFCLCAGLLDED